MSVLSTHHRLYTTMFSPFVTPVFGWILTHTAKITAIIPCGSLCEWHTVIHTHVYNKREQTADRYLFLIQSQTKNIFLLTMNLYPDNIFIKF